MYEMEWRALNGLACMSFKRMGDDDAAAATLYAGVGSTKTASRVFLALSCLAAKRQAEAVEHFVSLDLGDVKINQRLDGLSSHTRGFAGDCNFDSQGETSARNAIQFKLSLVDGVMVCLMPQRQRPGKANASELRTEDILFSQARSRVHLVLACMSICVMMEASCSHA